MTATVNGHAPARTILRVEPPQPAVSNAVRSPAPFRAVLSHSLIALALLIGWLISYLFVFSNFEEARAQKALYLQLRTALADGKAPITASIGPGTPVALLDVPGAGVHNVVVAEGTSASQLQNGPGHLRGSVLPGQQGVSVVAGRALTFGAPFASVPALRPGATITVTTGQGRFHYRVADVRRRGDPVPPAPGPGSARLTLVTADGAGALGALTPSATVFVDATLVAKPQPSAGVVAPVGSEAPMARDTSALTLTEIVLALQLFAVALVAVTWARARWSALAAWVAGTPLVIASLWLLTGIATRLLPNLM